MIHARIYKPTKTAMQSGRARTKEWLLEYEPATPKRPEPLMGWTSAGDTRGQVRIEFDTREAAIAFAEKKGLAWQVAEPHQRRIRPRTYLDNFKYIPPEEE